MSLRELLDHDDADHVLQGLELLASSEADWTDLLRDVRFEEEAFRDHRLNETWGQLLGWKNPVNLLQLLSQAQAGSPGADLRDAVTSLQLKASGELDFLVGFRRLRRLNVDGGTEWNPTSVALPQGLSLTALSATVASHTLKRLSGFEELDLTVTKSDPVTPEAVEGLLERNPLRVLRLKQLGYGERTDLTGIDFPAGLKSLSLGRFTVASEGLSAQDLRLEHCIVKGPALWELPALTQVFHMDDCPRMPNTLLIGPESMLRSLSLSLDEDFAESFFSKLVIDSASQLTKVYVNACAGWDIYYRGTLPQLNSVSHGAGQYGSFTVHTEDLQSAPKAPSALRKG